MKKIFSIISMSLVGMIVVFLITISLVKTNIGIETNRPKMINVFNNASTATATNGYNEQSIEYSKVIDELEGLTNISIFNRLSHQTTLKHKIVQDTEGLYAKWSTNLKLKNIVIELVYDRMQDVVVYNGENTRVISYFCIAYVISNTDKFTDVVAYYSTTNDSTKKDSEYAKCQPLVLKGVAKSLIDYVEEL